MNEKDKPDLEPLPPDHREKKTRRQREFLAGGHPGAFGIWQGVKIEMGPVPPLDDRGPDPEFLELDAGGVPVFRGTQVPIAVLFLELEEGRGLGEILQRHPTVTREQAIEALRSARMWLTISATSADGRDPGAR